MTGVYWCRKCKRQAFEEGGKWVPDHEAAKCPKIAKKVVCTLCFHKARLLQGVDLSRPSS